MMARAARACSVTLVVVFLAPLLRLLQEGQGSAAASTAAGGSPERWQRRQVQSLLRRLNKPALASIESADGDTIDCVHISKQPAFDHPLLKNHTIQMEPSYHPQGLYHESNSAPSQFTQSWHQNGKCPENTIPIRRTKEEDILRAISINQYGKKRPRSVPNNGHQHAVASAWGNDNYYGTKATFNLWQPKIERANDFSLAQLWITSGSYSSNDLNTIEAGWQVYPGQYKGSNPRLFVYWTRDAYHETGCYNLICPGFVQTNNQIAFGVTQLSPVSVYGGAQYEIDILVWKDPNIGNWWLRVESYDLGYWPSSMFSNLVDSASSVQWGGEVESDPNASQTSTEMGSGHFAEEGFSKASYIRNIQVVNPSNNLNLPIGVELLAEQPNCYDVRSGSSSNWGTYIFYGGPGKNPKCT